MFLYYAKCKRVLLAVEADPGVSFFGQDLSDILIFIQARTGVYSVPSINNTMYNSQYAVD